MSNDAVVIVNGARTPMGGFQGALGSVTATQLGAIAIRYPGDTLQWDPRATRFTNHEAANALINPPYRDGWSLPA